MRVWRPLVISVLVIVFIALFILILVASYIANCNECGADPLDYRGTNAAIESTNNWVNTLVARTETAIPQKTMTLR